MFSAALYARVRFLFYPWHTGPRVQRASGIPCSLIFEGDNDTQTSGKSCRENADVYLMIEFQQARRHPEVLAPSASLEGWQQRRCPRPILRGSQASGAI